MEKIAITREELNLITIALEQLTHSDTQIIEDLERQGLKSLTTAYEKELLSTNKLIDKIYKELYKIYEEY